MSDPTPTTDATEALWGDGGLFDQISRVVTDAKAEALREARRICGTCPIQLVCIRDNRDEPWARALVGASKPGPKPQPPGYRECEGCGVPMVGNKQPRPDGFAEHGGRGLCLACYSAARRRRERAA